MLRLWQEMLEAQLSQWLSTAQGGQGASKLKRDPYCMESLIGLLHVASTETTIKANNETVEKVLIIVVASLHIIHVNGVHMGLWVCHVAR